MSDYKINDHDVSADNIGVLYTLLEQLADASGTAMYVADYNTDRLLYLNGIATKILGVDITKAIGCKCYKFLMNNDERCSFCHKAVLMEDVFNYQNVVFPLNKHQYRIRSKIFTWRGRKVHAHFISDETEYLNSHSSVQAVIDQIPNGVGIYHVYYDGRIKQIYNNEGYYSILGSNRVEREQFSKFNVLEAVHPDDKKDCIEKLFDAIKNDHQFNYEMRIKKNNDIYKWIAFRADIIERREDYVTMYASLSDIDQLKKMQEVLQRNQAEIQMATDRAGILYWVYKVDTHQTVITNGKGYGYDEVINNVPEVFRGTGDVYVDDEIKYFDMFDQMNQGVESCGSDVRVYNHLLNKYQWQRVSFSKISDNRYVGSSIDITEQKRIEQKYDNELLVQQELLQDSVVTYKLNLTKEIVEDKITKYPNNSGRKPPFKLTEDLWKWGINFIKDESSKQEFIKCFATKSLLEAWSRGETSVELPVYKMKLLDQEKWYTSKALMVQRPDTGDIIAVTYTNNIDDKINNQMAIEGVLSQETEFVALIDSKLQTIRLVTSQEGEFNIPPLQASDFYQYRKTKIEPIVFTEDLDLLKQRYTIDEIIKDLNKQGNYALTYRKYYNDTVCRKRLRAFYLNDEHRYIVILRNDITDIYNEEVRQQEILKKALEDSREANRLKTDFLSRMSHDMRTPMNGILGLAQLSREETNIDVIKEYINQIELSGKVLLDLINDTLDMNKMDSGNLKLNPMPMDSEEVFSNIITNAQIMAAEKGIQLNLDLPVIDHDNWVPVICDASRLEQVFFNIISNAIKFTKPQGEVSIIFKPLGIENDMVTDKYIIKDTGIGMNPDFIPHVFDAFAQENRNRYGKDQGTGLGMSIVKQLVELMGGEISIKSELNKGTEVTLFMSYPVYHGKVKNDAINIENLDGLNGKRILLFEDHPLNAKIAKKLLEKQHMIVDVVENGKVGLNKYREAAMNYYDGILMDIRMPVMDGLEATKAIRNLDRKDAQNVPIIAMTANAFDEDVKQCLGAGMNAHLGKPIDARKLYITLSKYLDN